MRTTAATAANRQRARRHCADQPPAVSRRLPLPARGSPAGLADAPGRARAAGISQAQGRNIPFSNWFKRPNSPPKSRSSRSAGSVSTRRFCSATSSSSPRRWGRPIVSTKPAACHGFCRAHGRRTSNAFPSSAWPNGCSYVDRGVAARRKELGDQTALIGFAGSPWTLATFMMEGGSAEKYTRALDLFREDRKTFFALAEKLTAAVTAYLQMQIEAGVDALQIFDSHGGLLAPTEFQEASGRWIEGNHFHASCLASGVSRHRFLPRHARQLGRPAGHRRERAGH